jgi:hypothetical protein
MTPVCSCRRRPLLLGAGLSLLACPAIAQPRRGEHATLHAALRAADALDPYLADGVGEIAGALGRAMRVRGGAVVNDVPPEEDGIMVCVLRPERERRTQVRGVAIPGGLAASPAADPARRVVWADSDFLRVMAVQVSLWASRSLGGLGLGPIGAVAESRLSPPPSRPELWQPDSSPALRQQVLALISRGAGGFVLAHEMAHVLLGPPPDVAASLSALPSRARQLAPMCPALTDPAIAARRAYEDRADALALEAVLAGGDALGRAPIGLPGELGIATLLTLMLAADIVTLASVLESPLPQRFVQQSVGADSLARLRAAGARRPGTDLVGLVYSETHPAAVQRLVGTMRTLAQRPGSMWYGDSDPASNQALLLTLVERACQEAMQGKPTR